MAVRKPVVLVDGQLKEMPTGDTVPAANVPEVTAQHIHAATTKTTPVDADELGITDSAASWALKKLTFANLRTWIGSLFVSKSGDTMTGNLNVPSINGGQLAGLRNKIINGKMEIAQRGTSFISPTSNTYNLDRWVIGLATSGAITVSQQADAPGDNEFQNSLRVAVTTEDTSIAAGDALFLSHRVEGYNIRDLIGRTFTLSFWARSSKTGGHCVAFRNIGGDRSYVAEYTINAINTWEKKSVTVSGGLITAGTWDYTTGIGLSIFFTVAAGSNIQTTPNAWQVGNFQATANQVNGLDTVGNIFAITGVQLEVGSAATPFEHRPYCMELSLCQRYYYRLTPGVGQPFGYGSNYNTTSGRFAIIFPVTMRTAPAALEQSGVANQYAVSQAGIGNTVLSSVPLFSVATREMATVSGITGGGLTNFTPGTLSADATNGATAFLAFSAEL